MAKEISDIVKQCKVLLLDIEGTTTSISFVKDKLFPYAEENVKSFLDGQWDDGDVKDAVGALRKLALEDREKSVDGVVDIPGEDATKEDQIEGLVNNIKWQMSSDRKAGPLKQLQGLIWKQGYDKGEIKGHVYDDVSPAIELWRSTDGKKVYIYSSGSVQAQKLLFGQSLAGDMLPLIDGHFDTGVGSKQEVESYKKIVEQIGCKADEVLFLTDIVKEAAAAREAGLHTALVSREGNAPIPDEEASAYTTINSFSQLATSNKRKTDDQEEQPASKVPKTDDASDVKMAEETAASTKSDDKVDKMEVETEPTNGKTEEQKPTEEAPMVVETVVEEITDSNEPTDAVHCDAEPIVSEAETTEPTPTETENGTDKPAENKEEHTNGTDKENGASITDDTPPVVVSEVEDKQLDEVADIIEDIVPVVEEPPSVPQSEADISELQNVGESLEKECDEILSKVQDVTNLDNITVKPMLNPIPEDMETENIDSNDIVDRILDTELEMEKADPTPAEKPAKDSTPEEVKETAEETDKAPETKETEPQKETETDTKPSEDTKDSAEAPEKVAEGKPEVPETPELPKVPEVTVTEAPEIPEVPEVPKEEAQVNGNATNGGGDEKVNGDSNGELKSRLSENGAEVLNGNGNGNAEEGQGDGKPANEVAEIKVKTVAAAESIDPIEQPTEA